jgi:hypothetical protein
MPPARKKRIELIKYMIPIFLWSVVVSHAYRPPRTAGAAGLRVVVAIPALPYWTVSVPVMLGWTVQMKGYVPAASAGTA